MADTSKVHVMGEGGAVLKTAWARLEQPPLFELIPERVHRVLLPGSSSTSGRARGRARGERDVSLDERYTQMINWFGIDDRSVWDT